MTKFLFVVLAVAAGVGALSGVQGFSASFRGTLLDESREVMAADLTARQFVPASEQEVAALDALAQRGVQHTLITETISMASSTQAAPNSDAATPVLISDQSGGSGEVSLLWCGDPGPAHASATGIDGAGPLQSRKTCCCG